VFGLVWYVVRNRPKEYAQELRIAKETYNRIRHVVRRGARNPYRTERDTRSAEHIERAKAREESDARLRIGYRIVHVDHVAH